jgi:hypothetical protein
VIHNGAVPLDKIDSENLRLAGNRQEFGFEIFQASGEGSIHHVQFPLLTVPPLLVAIRQRGGRGTPASPAPNRWGHQR